ncbi:protein of unknown function [Sterolibacterium denitrificans]|uniref:Uncharacterized protein n=2 Tax=Sterolibacterium denitrificans TaxID=157592 RepID=A0A656Z7T3_9PROT|nr:hypothetical protein [Sterolibacterium denitrificans]KYC29084.1 hypothetical protein ACY05_00400 [Sterolibacterium denitrificans]SMB21410.1 protein of unknown function [Sterolibacterium denitrificans]
MSHSLRVVTLEEVTPDSVLGEDVRRADGMLVLAAGVVLAESHLGRLRDLGIPEVVIVGPAADAADATAPDGAASATSAEAHEALEQAERARVNRLFRKSEDDRVTRDLFQAVLEYRLGKLK